MRPDMYKKSIFDINYDLLKTKGIKVLLFDFDNTLIEKERLEPHEKHIDLFQKLIKNFKVLIVSNTLFKKKIDKFSKACNVEYIINARKPSKSGFLKIETKLGHKDSEICMIGDQLLTDIKGGKKRGYFTILVDPIKTDAFFVTKINRFREYFIYRRLKETNDLTKGGYYE